ncbi:sugar ABC transporter ATP-binding protein [Alkalibacter mobilis]|uniref:sugar ABC transporter ATP-binding protein n=1 Tax=Alkalibacter mobilis TaxID=2787712 RepID=UPI00189EE720|nr:sugar ABC transporter ATP-binding protein [Alkalibacter mobilis]MBF7095575.1 sugar ABC transporter ATP-binding protein [Alkalibacter mobilis]
MKNIVKEFSGVRVLDNVDFNIYKGKIMALVGENGAGKSTLMKILTGVYLKTSGDIYLEGKEVNFTTTKESQDMGVAIIHQELNLVQDLSISENIFLGREPVGKSGKIKWKQLYDESKQWLDKLGLNESPKELVKNLSVGKQQLIEIAKALSLNAKVIIMDEPTGALTISETEKLFEVVNELRSQGHSIVYISHRLNEIFQICDYVTVLRDGTLVGEKTIDELDEDKIIEMMVGRKLSEQYPRVNTILGHTVLEVKNLSNKFVKDISFELKEGEILGVAGLVGAGRTEMARSIYGVYPLDKGEILMKGKPVVIKSPKDAIKEGIAYVSEDRKSNGIVLGLNIVENVTLASLDQYVGKIGKINKSEEEKSTDSYVKSMSIKAAGTKQLLKFLSGGNQQKVALAKNLNTNPKILILDEPTRGVDVGAKKEIYELINKYKESGMSILMISSEIPEILGISDRVMVMHEGMVTGTLDIKNADQEKIMSLAVGKEVS